VVWLLLGVVTFGRFLMLNANGRRLSVMFGVLLVSACASNDQTGEGGSGGTGALMVGTGGAVPGYGGSGLTAGNPTTVPPSGAGGTPVSNGSGGATASQSSGGSTPITGAGGVATPQGGTTSGSGGATTSVGGTTTSAGGTTTAMGGATSVGGAPTASCTPMTGMNMVTDTGGYVLAGMWKGYAFTATSGAGTSIAPGDYSTLTAGQALCACGTVKGTMDYSGVAMIGVNLNQGTGGVDPMTIMPSGMGITVAIAGAMTTPLRLQIQGPMGATDASQRWCADLPAAGGTIAWTDFKFECWEGGMKTPFNGTDAIQSVIVQVPGSTTDIPFNFCVTSLSGG
jgi:hypothetical protein